MRTTELKIGDEKKEAILIAGGPGFKIYSAIGIDGWVVVSGRKTQLIEKDQPEFKAVGDFVNLRYQAQSEQEKIKSTFEALVKSKFESLTNTSDKPEADSIL